MDNGVMQVIIGGKPWPVPVLAAKQNRIIDPLILGLLPVFAAWQDDRAGALTKLEQKATMFCWKSRLSRFLC